MTSPTYTHTQRSPALIALNLVLAAVSLVLLFLPATADATGGVRLTIGVVTVVLVATAVGFSSLRVTVRDGMLRWQFGPGVLRKTVPLSLVATAEPTTTSFLEGWGVHLTTRGWLYNVAGRRAVLVTLHDGRRFMVGTDEPEQLAAAILAGRRGGR